MKPTPQIKPHRKNLLIPGESLQTLVEEIKALTIKPATAPMMTAVMLPNADASKAPPAAPEMEDAATRLTRSQVASNELDSTAFPVCCVDSMSRTSSFSVPLSIARRGQDGRA